MDVKSNYPPEVLAEIVPINLGEYKRLVDASDEPIKTAQHLVDVLIEVRREWHDAVAKENLPWAQVEQLQREYVAKKWRLLQVIARGLS